MSDASSLVQYVAGMGFVYQLFQPTLREWELRLAPQVVNSKDGQRFAAFLARVATAARHVRSWLMLPNFIAMLLAIAFLIILTIDPGRCLFVLNHLCMMNQKVLIWALYLSIMILPLAVSMTCFGLQVACYRMIMYATR
jgi:hypothetical protein